MREVEYMIYNQDCITEKTKLAEISECVSRLIAEHGADAEVNFDSGYTDITEQIVKYVEE